MPTIIFLLPAKQKMAAGHPLTDEDRAPWLQTLNGLLRRWDEEGSNGVLACSALKSKYHETLEAGIPSDAYPVYISRWAEGVDCEAAGDAASMST